MALKATVCKVQLSVADMGRHHYGNYSLTVARHPSETDERMMVRLLAFALHASDTLAFSRGLCVEDEPALWQKNLHDEIELWVELGQAEERRLRQACARSQQVVLYGYQPRSAAPWWRQMEKKVAQLENLRVYQLDSDSTAQLATLATRTMQLQCTVQEGTIWIGNAETTLSLQLEQWK